MDINKIKIQLNATIIDALKQMDREKVKVLIVMNDLKFCGLITIGDIQRAIIKNIGTNEYIKNIFDADKQYAKVDEPLALIKKKMLSMRAEIMPVVDENKNLIKVYYWDDFFNDSISQRKDLNVPVVIMAGGKGERLQPLTNIYPKPLIPIGEKTIIETIMDKFVGYNCNQFYISVNYKAETIRNYFHLLNNQSYKINYFQEEKPMGTAGSLRLLKNKLDSTFFVSNCDIIVNDNYADFLDYHRKNKNDMTIIAAIKTYSIPYGTINTGEDGLFESITEKPCLTYKINTGLYILEPSVIDKIPDSFFHITDLMDKLKSEGLKVGVYPISQNDWIDMGDWGHFLELIKK